MNPDFRLIAATLQRDGVAHPAAPRVPVRPRPWPAQLRRAVQRWWQRLWMDEMTAYLSEATSHVDLEYRIRAWNDADRCRRMPIV